VQDPQVGLEPEPFVAALNRTEVVREVQAREAEEQAVRAAAVDWRGTVRARLAVAGVALALWVGGIEARLVVLQIVQRDDLVARAERQRNRTLTIAGKRGDLVDRTGHVLAYSVDGDAIYAEPVLVSSPGDTASAVCRAIEGCTPRDREQMTRRLSQRRAFAYLWRRASPDDALRIRQLGLKGVGLIREDRRYYPNRDLAAHVLGYVGLDNEGLGGLERAYESQISGQPGVMLLQTDARNTAFGRIQQPPTEGATLELRIDQYLQHVAERELEEGIAEFGARAGTAIVLEPRSGEVLALANWPTFNPNAFGRVRDEKRRNRAVQEVYEPGSTFKVVTASAALEERLVRPTEMFDVSAGAIRFGARVIEDVHRYGPLSFTDVIVKSSNVGAIKIGLRVGAERLGRYIQQFGFGQPVLRELPGETQGIVWSPDKLNDSALASISMGYQVGVTPIQMVTAVASIANGGELVAPRLVRAVVRGNERVETARRVLRRAVSPATAATLTAIMETVVEEGTGKAARIEGFTVAGKTGTAAKLEGGRYSKSDYNASMVGFVPSRDPAIAVLVVIDSPHGKGYYGGTVAAPIFKRIAEKALSHLGVAPTINPGPRVLLAGAGGDQTDMRPVAARAPALLMPASGPPAVQGLMPDLRGMCAREATRALAQLGLVGRLVGDGVVVEQGLPPGGTVQTGATCVLRLNRRTAAPSPGGTP